MKAGVLPAKVQPDQGPGPSGAGALFAAHRGIAPLQQPADDPVGAAHGDVQTVCQRFDVEFGIAPQLDQGHELGDVRSAHTGLPGDLLHLVVPGDEIVGFVTRGRGITIHRTDCVNVLNMPEIDRKRLIEAEWQMPDRADSEKYEAEIQVYANNRTGLLVDISKIFTERKIDIRNINCRTNKQEKATISVSFNVSCKDELNSLIEKIRQLESVLDVERTTG